MAKKQYNLFYNPLLPFPVELTAPSKFPVYFNRENFPEPDLYCDPRISSQFLDLQSERGLVQEDVSLVFRGVTYPLKVIKFAEVI